MQTSANSFLASVISYVEGRADEDALVHIQNYADTIKNSRNIISAYLSSIAFKEMQHLVNLLDSLHLAEQRLFSAETILEKKPEDLALLHTMIKDSIETTFTMLMSISDKLGSRNYAEFKFPPNLLSNGSSLTTPELVSADIRKKLDLDTLPRESRDRLRNVLTTVIANNADTLNYDTRQHIDPSTTSK